MFDTRRNIKAPLMTSGRSFGRPLADTDDTSSVVSFVLTSGGDMRIWPDADSGRNQYGTRAAPAPEEISFSSTTASNISPEGFAAATLAMDRLLRRDPATSIAPEEWFDEIRAALIGHLGIPGSRAILAASGTDAELLALGLAATLSPRPLTNIFIAPDETGNGIPQAAAGRHFSNMTALGQEVRRGDAILGLSWDRVTVRTAPIRDAAGRPRDADAVDDDVVVMVEQELRHGRDVLLHVLDASKTGLRGVRRQTARALAALAPGRVRIVIDACQLRNPLAELRRDLADGFMVLVTGSKFAAGPPFAGALLLPPAIIDEVSGRVDLAEGLSDYTAALDWPEELRANLGFTFKLEANIGLGLRWIAALQSIAAYGPVPEPLQAEIIDLFDREARARSTGVQGVVIHPDDAAEPLGTRSIVPLTVMTNADLASMEVARRIQARLREASEGPVCHVGQAVKVGPRTVLRIAISAREVAAVADRVANGQSPDRAFAPVAADLDTLFRKWSAIERLGT